MELVEAGYKMTEVGMIPSDWNIFNLGNTSILKARIGWQGLTTAEYQATGEYVLITGTDFDEGFINWESCVFVSKDRFDQDKNIQIATGDILVTKDGTIGKVAYIDSVPLPTTLNSGVFVIRPKNYNYDPKFFYHILMSVYFKEFLSKLSAGSTINHLYQKDFIHFDFPVPPTLTEQKAIATALSDVDALISSLDRLIEKKKEIKQGAMQELLTPPDQGGKRLEGFSGEWHTGNLGDITSIQTGKMNNQDKEEDGIYPFFVRSQTVERINQYSYNEESILVPGEGNIGRIFHHIIGKFEVHQRVYRIHNFHEQVSGRFIYYMLIDGFYDHAMTNTVKATVDSLRLPTFQNFPLCIPNTLNEQLAIVEILDDIQHEIQELKIKRDKYKLIKQGMMQELLTGKTRLI